jgi:hypothetical protein
MRDTGKQGRDVVLKFSEHKRKRVDDLEDDVDALFRLPLAEFTGARNALAARLKKSGRGDEKAESVQVKALTRPSISAWAVNQLYWNHREEFDRLIASAGRFHKAQTSRGGAKIADMRTALDARREALTHLSDLATSLLRDAAPNPGQKPSPDTIHRITSTLEGISAFASRTDGPRPGRLTHDVDPPGFESLAGFVPDKKSVATAVASGSTTTKQKPGHPPATAGGTDFMTPRARLNVGAEDNARRVEQARKAKIAAAKVLVQDAKRSVTEARARAQSLEAAQKKADAEAKKAEKHRRDAEEELRKAKAVSEAAARRARSVAVEIEEAAKALKDAELTVGKVSRELESLM